MDNDTPLSNSAVSDTQVIFKKMTPPPPVSLPPSPNVSMLSPVLLGLVLPQPNMCMHLLKNTNTKLYRAVCFCVCAAEQRQTRGHHVQPGGTAQVWQPGPPGRRCADGNSAPLIGSFLSSLLCLSCCLLLSYSAVLRPQADSPRSCHMRF